MIRAHFLHSRNAFVCSFQCAFLLLAVLTLTSGVAKAQSSYSECMEDGGTAYCTSPGIVDQPGQYSLWEIRTPENGGNADWPGLNSDQDISNQITSLDSPSQSDQTPSPPYTWNVLPYNGSGYQISETPDISAQVGLGNNCSAPIEYQTFYGQRVQPLSCPVGWINSTGTPTTNYPAWILLAPRRAMSSVWAVHTGAWGSNRSRNGKCNRT